MLILHGSRVIYFVQFKATKQIICILAFAELQTLHFFVK